MSLKGKSTIHDFLHDDHSCSINIIDPDNYYENIVRGEINNIFEGPNRETNVDFFDLSSIKDISLILDAFNTYPYLGKFRYVIVKVTGKSNKDAILQIADYLKNPSKTTKHIFLCGDDKTNLSCELVIKDDYTQANMKAFIKDELKKRNIQLDNRAVDQLSAKNFSNRLTLINEIDKISTILTSDNHDTKIIDELIDETRRESFDQTYNLMNYINNKDLKSCLLELKKTKFTENIFLEISKIAWRFRVYLKIKTLKKTNMKESEIIKNVNVSKYQYRYLDAESKKKTFEEILTSIKVLRNTDRLLKSTDINHDIISFYLLKKLCGQ
jgi:DNA polymerase III delta subunit